MDLETFVKERDQALLSLDKTKIIKYMKTYEIEVPKDNIMLWAVVHKTILQLFSATDKQKDISKKWLKDNGFNGTVKVYEAVQKDFEEWDIS